MHKVTIDAGFTCPNLDGTRGRGGCTYCNNTGFSPNVREPAALVRDQIARGIAAVSRHRKVRRFIAYFQAYSNTYAPVATLKAPWGPEHVPRLLSVEQIERDGKAEVRLGGHTFTMTQRFI